MYLPGCLSTTSGVNQVVWYNFQVLVHQFMALMRQISLFFTNCTYLIALVTLQICIIDPTNELRRGRFSYLAVCTVIKMMFSSRNISDV